MQKNTNKHDILADTLIWATTLSGGYFKYYKWRSAC